MKLFDDIIELPADAMPDISELSGDLRLLAEVPGVGVELALRIGQTFNGTALRLWGVHKFVRRWRDKRMRAEYDRGGITVVELARKYHLGERQTYNILGVTEATANSKQLKLW